MFEKLVGVKDSDEVIVKVADIRVIANELQSTHDSLMKENEQLNKQITLNTSRCLCYKGALEVLNQLVEESVILPEDQKKEVITPTAPSEVKDLMHFTEQQRMESKKVDEIFNTAEKVISKALDEFNKDDPDVPAVITDDKK